MKTITAYTSEEPQWDKKLIRDLSFIKKHLRYPFTIKTIYPVVIVLMLLIILTWFTLAVLSKIAALGISWMKFVPVAVVAATSVISLCRYLLTLRFSTLTTNYYSVQNQNLLVQFLKAQHLPVFRHPDTPEVFQIASNADTLNDQREILTFIVDDKRILFNSYFAYTTKIIFNPGKRHNKQMAKMLKEWIYDYERTGNSTSLSQSYHTGI